MKVFIGFAEALAAPETAWSLVDAGFEVITFSRRGRRAALRHSQYVSVEEVTAPEKDFAATTQELAALFSLESKTETSVFLPLDDASVWLGAQMSLPPGCLLGGPRGVQAELALDKGKQIEAARAAGFYLPETSIISREDELDQITLNFPLILRPAHAVLPHGLGLTKGTNWICSDRAELERARRSWQGKYPLLVQPYLQGVGEGVFGFATSKSVVAWSSHRRLRMMNPHGSGSSACRSRLVDEEVRVAAQNFLTAVDWRGLFMIELLRDDNGRCSFVEFNGRPWGSMALARRQGLDYPAWNVALAREPDFSPSLAAAFDREMECRNIGRELMHLLFVLRGPKSRAIHNWPSFWKTLREFLRLPRPTFFYNWRRNDRKVFWSDIVNTLCDQVSKRKS